MPSRSKRRASATLVAGAAALCATVSAAQGAPKESTSLTIYSSSRPGAIPPELYRPVIGGGMPHGMAVPGYALVRHDRPIDLKAGRETLRFTDVAAFIDPTTVQFSSLTDPEGTRVLEQNFQFDLVSTQKLLSRYIDRQVALDRVVGDEISTLEGTLLSSVDGLVLRGKDGQIHAIREYSYSGLRFGELPGGLITRPTLIWDVTAKKGGTHNTRVSYQTSGITWWTDYNLVFSEGANANSGFLDVGAWVSIINQSGATYSDAKLKLIAGDVNRAPPPPSYKMLQRMENAAAAPMADAGFQQQAFFEFHLYTLGRPSTLPNNSTKQIELFEAAKRVPAKKVLVYYGLETTGWFFPEPAMDRNLGGQSNTKVDVYLEFKNDEKTGLGIPLPAGRIRVAQQDKNDGSMEFIGEDVIDHTPRNEEVRVKLGSAFDVVGERKQVDFTVNTTGKWMEEEIEVKVRNRKQEPVEVLVRENLYRWTNWNIVKSTHKHEKQDSRTIHFPVRIEKDAEAVVRYRVRYTW